MNRPSAPRNRLLMVEEGGIGGVANYTAALSVALAEAGWEVHLATGRDHDPASTPGVQVHRLFTYLRGRGPLGRLVRRIGLGRLVNGASHLLSSVLVARLARDFDLVHVQGEEWPPLGAAQALLLRLVGRPWVYTPHNTFDRQARSYPRAHAIIRGCAARIVVHSRYDVDSLKPSHAAKSVVIPHGDYAGLARPAVTDREVLRARRELDLDEHHIVVLLFGQLRPDKGVRDLLQAAVEVTPVTVVLAGEDHGALAEVQDLLAHEGLRDRVFVHPGFIPTATVDRLFAAADVVALPYRNASASGVLSLAYAYARPVLIYPVGGLPEYIIAGESGWICARPDVPALAEQLAAIASGGREECRTRGRAAKRYSEERLAWREIATRTIDLYREILAPLSPS